jgi:hypothetical protein
VVDVMEIVVVDVMEIVVVDVMEIVVVDVMEIVAVDVMEIVAVDVMETDEDAMRIAIQRVELAEKVSVIETVREEMNKKSPMGRETNLVDDRETGVEIPTDQTKKAKDAMEGKHPESIGRIAGIPNPTKALLPLTRRPMRPRRKSRAALVSFWPGSLEANRLGEINPKGNAIKWKFSGFAVVLP